MRAAASIGMVREMTSSPPTSAKPPPALMAPSKPMSRIAG